MGPMGIKADAREFVKKNQRKFFREKDVAVLFARRLATKAVAKDAVKLHRLRSDQSGDRGLPERSGGMVACHAAKAVDECEAPLHKLQSNIIRRTKSFRNKVEGWLSPV